MIKLRRSVRDEFNYDVDFYVRKEAIIGVFQIQKRARIMLISGIEIEVHESAETVLELLKTSD